MCQLPLTPAVQAGFGKWYGRKGCFIAFWFCQEAISLRWRDSKMHDLMIALLFVAMIASPCLVAARAGKNSL